MKHKEAKTKKLSTKPNAYDTPKNKTITTPTAPAHLHNLQINNSLSLLPQSYRNALSTSDRPIQNNNLQHSALSHIALRQPTIDDI